MVVQNINQTIADFKSFDKKNFAAHSQEFLNILLAQDRLLGTRSEFRVGRWIEQARNLGTTPEEKDLTTVRGTSSPGNPMAAVNCPIQEEIISRNPEARRIPTDTISPMSVGMILRTVKNPFRAPLMKCS
jgi:hypothetical protein